ncbi:MAG: hypothetical protein Ct9H90mP16_03220 [Candidatus Poseidoniales archaeon]|nr:MAG: hypothetical protein Ct9H90mP16_03220 [Candidatus Poseidoniales archaeon]
MPFQPTGGTDWESQTPTPWRGRSNASASKRERAHRFFPGRACVLGYPQAKKDPHNEAAKPTPLDACSENSVTDRAAPANHTLRLMVVITPTVCQNSTKG